MAQGTVERAVADLVVLGRAYPADVAPRFEPPASAAELGELEDAIGGALPDDVADLLRACGAIVAMDVHNGYWIGGPVELARSIRRRDYPAELEIEGQAAPAIPLATDGGGNAFLVAADCSVWRWNHETGASSFVAGTLVEFLGRVAEDWKHDLRGDETWTYLV